MTSDAEIEELIDVVDKLFVGCSEGDVLFVVGTILAKIAMQHKDNADNIETMMTELANLIVVYIAQAEKEQGELANDN
jgi:hypothetical protein